MELRHLKYFVVVAEELHFTRAAERLGMAQPPLSQQIRKLEHEIGALLFRRLTRGIELTDAGRVLYEDARRIVDHVELAKTRAQSAARGQTGHIRVGFASSVVFHPVIAEIVRTYRDTHPDVRLSPSESNVAALIEDLLDERIDVAIIRQAAHESERVQVEELFDEEMVIVLPPKHRLAGRTGIQLHSLAQETLIMFPRSIAPVLYDEVISACQRAGFSPQLGQESTQVASAVSMVAAGFGVSIVPHSIRQLAATGVTYHAIEGPAPRAQIAIACRSTEFSKVVRDFMEVARRASKDRHHGDA
ncbi:LysR family transcriptional regulator [Paraburkholderia silviterrae]|uniref:LysR family transcriptional regulator n=1 Tax=Paraburkholderia silviterrae TaxID=2528715 RepID=A0A4R5M6H6_9BURK|nr:LysR family transcriptional regulator [Paraburkholderia silviterrae]TDG21728.1 LysR family transcriptional regulator [Paraburkholderia silviterrae]